MAFISPIMFSSLAQMSVVSTTVTAVTTLTAGVAKDFFMHLFMNPGKNFVPIMIVCAVFVAAGVGSIFLIKMIYNKCMPDKSK